MPPRTISDNEVQEQPQDNVNHPKHYNSHPSGIECIDIARYHDFNIGNAIKYLWRAGLKGGEEKIVEDLRKAIFYINDEIEMILKKQEQKKAEHSEN